MLHLDLNMISQSPPSPPPPSSSTTTTLKASNLVFVYFWRESLRVKGEERREETREAERGRERVAKFRFKGRRSVDLSALESNSASVCCVRVGFSFRLLGKPHVTS